LCCGTFSIHWYSQSRQHRQDTPRTISAAEPPGNAFAIPCALATLRENQETEKVQLKEGFYGFAHFCGYAGCL
jgi:hypothetical protein